MKVAEAERVSLDHLNSKFEEIEEYHSQFKTAYGDLLKAKSGSDQFDLAAADLTVLAVVLKTKLQSFEEILDEELDSEQVALIQELEEMRASLGANSKPMSVQSFLELVASTLKISLKEVPAPGTYWRWLKEASTGNLRISEAHAELFKRFLAKLTRTRK